MSYIVFDIESGPNERAFEFIGGFKAPSTWKDPEKIKANIAEQTSEALSEAALSATTGKVLVIGALTDTGEVLFFEGEEKTLLREWWKFYKRNAGLSESTDVRDFVGFNSSSFDWPFLYRRSLINGLTHSVGLPRIFNDRGYLPDHLIDLRKIWCCGDRMTKGSLDVLCMAFGVAGKKSGMTGADFSITYKENREKALSYLMDDLKAIKGLAERML